MEISLTWDTSRVRGLLGDGLAQATKRALKKAGRDALRKLKTASKSKIRDRKRIRVSRISKSLPTFLPRTSSIEGLEWRMDVSGKAIPLVDYPHSETRKGVSVAVNVGRRVLIRSAFEAVMRSGHRGVFMRRGKARLPIDELYSTRVSDVFRDVGMIPAVMTQALQAFGVTFDRVFPYEVQAAMAKAVFGGFSV